MRRSLNHGFTLIEMLVSLALMGMIAIILITSLQLGGHTWQRVMRAAGSTEDVAQAQETLRLRLSTLYPDSPEGATAQQPFLASNGSSLQFWGEAPESTSDGILRYQLAISSLGALEIRSSSDHYSHATIPGESKAEALLPNIASLAVQFWLKPEASPGRWVDHWESNKLPQLIRIDVAFGANDRRRWPPLYIEPRIDTPATCVFDVVSRRCRSGA